MTTAKMKNAAPSPTAYRVLRGRPVRSLPYPLVLRIHDWWAGRRDGRVEAASAQNGTTATTLPSTAWLTHDQHREIERRTDEQLAHQARTVQLQMRYDTVVADLVTAEEQLAQTRKRVDDIQPLSEEDTTQRRATETHIAPDVVRLRRQREYHTTVVAPTHRQAADAQTAVTALTIELHDLTARLETLAEITATRQARIIELHERRRALYARAHARAQLRAQQRTGSSPTPLRSA